MFCHGSLRGKKLNMLQETHQKLIARPFRSDWNRLPNGKLDGKYRYFRCFHPLSRKSYWVSWTRAPFHPASPMRMVNINISGRSMQIGPESYAIPTFPRSVISSGERKMSGCLTAASGQIMAWEVVSNAPGAAHLSSSASRWNRPQRVVAYPVTGERDETILIRSLMQTRMGEPARAFPNADLYRQNKRREWGKGGLVVCIWKRRLIFLQVSIDGNSTIRVLVCWQLLAPVHTTCFSHFIILYYSNLERVIDRCLSAYLKKTRTGC